MKLQGPAFRFRRGIAGKLALSLLLSIVLVFAVFGYINLRLQQHATEELLVQSAERISDVIQRSTRVQMMHNDRGGLYQVIREIGTEPGLRRIRIFNKEGRISFSTDATEVGRVVDKQAEACYGCHRQGAPLEKLSRPDKFRIFEQASGPRVLGMIRPIENSPTCSSASCHAHPAAQRILGVIDVNLSLAAVDAHLAETQWHVVLFTVIAVVLVCAISAIFIWVVVYKPIRRLITGTHRVADGDLEYRLHVGSEDELGDLAASFNKMTAELEDANREITEWARTLEVRVDKKTRELERAHVSLVQSEKMASLGKLAATVAHEVNNPLFGILTYARLCIKELEGAGLPAGEAEKFRNRLRLIEGESRRCGDLIKNLLTFARQAPQRREPNNINELIGRALALVNHKFELQGIEIECDLAPDAPPVLCDPGQVQQVLLVLFVNAGEAMTGGGKLSVSTRFDEEHDYFEIRVEDTGSGIPAEVLENIFEPFFTTKEDQMRTGLGLAVARSIVEQHAGTIGVESVPGKGTQFTITLPREAAVPAKLEAVAGKA